MTAPAPAKEKPDKWLVTLAIAFGALMSTIDASIVNVAMPQIRSSVGATVQEITWIGTGYAIAMVIVMPLTGFIGRLFGQKRSYLFCLLLFTAGSALCGLAGSLTALVVYRVIQGMGGGALQPIQMAILRQTFPPREQAMAMALFGVVVMLGPAIGPTLGGFIVDHWHWSWIFYINVPIGVIGFFAVTAFVQEDEEIVAANRARAERERRDVDWPGIVLLSIGLVALQYFLEEGNPHGWFEDGFITATLVVALLALAAFVVREFTTPVPVVDLRLFFDPLFAAGTAIGFAMFAVLMASMFLMPIFMQELLGFTAMQSGLALVPRVTAMLVAMPIVGRLYHVVSPRIVIGVGVLLVFAGSWMMGRFTLGIGTGDIVLPIVIQGIGFACLFVPLTTVSLDHIPRHHIADAAGLNTLVRQLGGAVGMAVFGTLLGNYSTEARAGLSAHLSAADPLVQERLAATAAGLQARGFDPAAAQAGALAALDGAVARQAALLSFDRLFILTGVVFLLTLPLLIFLKARKGRHPAPLPGEEGA
jgi:DHA2 family multidrug resistance protein